MAAASGLSLTLAQVQPFTSRCLRCQSRKRASDSRVISGDHWPDDVGLSDIETRFVYQACGKRGQADRNSYVIGAGACGCFGLAFGLARQLREQQSCDCFGW